MEWSRSFPIAINFLFRLSWVEDFFTKLARASRSSAVMIFDAGLRYRKLDRSRLTTLKEQYVKGFPLPCLLEVVAMPF
jgi:hypothetical protein